MSICGLDFGTSHSTMSVFNNKQEPVLVSYPEDGPIVRSAIFFDYEHNKVIFGKGAISTYLNGNSGRLMVGLKSILGSSLMEEQTVVMGKPRKYKDILAMYIDYMKRNAEIQSGQKLTKVVAGRPVRFSDDDDNKDNLAQQMLTDVFKDVGFTDVKFQYEPVAAAFDYWRHATKPTTIVIADLGGGTCDFTAMHLPIYGKGEPKILATDGIHIGGTDLDTLLNVKTIMPHLGMGTKMRGSSADLIVPSSVYHDLSTWHCINWLYQNKADRDVADWYPAAYDKNKIELLLKVIKNREAHSILHETERVKRILSDQPQEHFNKSDIDERLKINIKREEFEEVIANENNKLSTVMDNLLIQAQLDSKDVDLVYFTGGTSFIPLIQNTLAKRFTTAEISSTDLFGSVGKGLSEYAKLVF